MNATGAVFLAILLAASPLVADAPDEGKMRRIWCGFSASVVDPTNTPFGDSSIGSGFSVFLENALTKTIGTRIQFEYLGFGTSDDRYTERNLLLDLLFRLQSHNKGGYWFVGVGTGGAEISPRKSRVSGRSPTMEAGACNSFSIGFGRNFNQHLGAEVRYKNQKLEDKHFYYRNVSYFQASFICRFR
jgi:hypothetical protein